MRYKILLLAVITSLCLSVVISPARAHILKTDGSIGGVLHVDPDDDPIINKSTSFIIEFEDTNNKFDLQNCTCNLAIVKDGQDTYSQPLSSNDSKTTAATAYTFTSKGLYQVVVTGSSTDNSFASFKLTYDLRVDRTIDSVFSGNLHWLAIGGILLVFFVILFWKKRGTK